MNSFGLNEFESGFSIRMPQSIVRSVSLDKISKGAALTDRNFSASNTSLEKSNCKEN